MSKTTPGEGAAIPAQRCAITTEWKTDLLEKGELMPVIEKVTNSLSGIMDLPGIGEDGVYNIEVSRNIQNQLISSLDPSIPEHARILRYMEMPDLTRDDNSILKLIIDNITNLEVFSGFDHIRTPEIVPAFGTFDLFNFPENHPARTKSDTYYVDENYILKTHTTIMWYYYFSNPLIRQKLSNEGSVKAISYGKVYRKDEIDSKHHPVFHQIDGLYLIEKDKKIIDRTDLEKVLIDVAKEVFGDVEYRINNESYPYTDPSLEMEVKFGDNWLEILGGGIVSPQVLENHGIDSSKYNGWAFGFGVERLAMIKKGIPDIRSFWSKDERYLKQWGDLETKFNPVSKYPSTERDISFVIDKSESVNNYFEIVRDEAGELIEEVKMIDKYENEKKFGADRISYTFRMTYRSSEKTLTNEEVNEIQERIRNRTQSDFNAVLR
ncbi:MAG: hypothetical protein PHS92_04985 [Candidatus Gracilibacteria bacterium]|nr:hypothetical protein [Candidatus Gracilibacteria bacterium]